MIVAASAVELHGALPVVTRAATATKVSAKAAFRKGRAFDRAGDASAVDERWKKRHSSSRFKRRAL